MSDAPKDFWESFGDDSDFIEVTCEDSGSLACDVLTEYGIPYENCIGGGLNNLDIKRMDAIQVIKLSLLETSASDNTIYEPIVNEEGKVEFISVGGFIGLSGGDIYYEIQSASYRERCGGVMVQGAKPLPYRKPVEWHNIKEKGYWQLFNTGLLINKECIKGNFNQQSTIVFNDPNLDSRYEDGIDNLYEINSSNPYDNIIGYARYIYFPGWETNISASVTQQSTARIPISLTEGPMGTFRRRPEFSDQLDNEHCFDDQGIIPDSKDGVELIIPEEFRYETTNGIVEDKLIDINELIVIGIPIDQIRGEPPSDSEAIVENPEPGSADTIVIINKSYSQAFTLTKGQHYTVVYKDIDSPSGARPFIVFSNNSRAGDPIKIDGTKLTQFKIDPKCDYYKEIGSPTGEGYILHTEPGVGILVEQIYAVVTLNTPSIVVYHPDGWNNESTRIAGDLDFLLAPLVVTEEPAPVAFNGRLIDLTQGIRDHDPTTAQNFSDTDLEKAYDEMAGNGMNLTLTFLDEDQCTKLSGALYDYINSGDGTEATYVCAPGTEVKLGGTAPNGGIVNSITYSYQDSNSYTVSVNAGATTLGNFAQIDGGPALKLAEDFSAGGTIVQDMGNHIYFKVRIDGLGERVAVNMSQAILRVGDKVQCTVHNNPVEM